MATQTPNYNLIKPDYTDTVDVDVLNDNADLIDSALTAKANLVGGKVPASELPSYVDDVIEGYYYNGAFYTDVAHTDPITGEQGKIYIDLSTETCFRWSGSVYVQISSPDADFYWCTYDTTLDAQGIAEAYAELTAAFTAGRILVFYNSQRLFICNYYIGGNDPKFYFMSYDDSLRIRVLFGPNTGWSNWVTAIMATKQYVDNAIAEAGQLPQGTNEGDILYWDDVNDVWASGDITKAATFDSTPTQNSLNPVTSGGVYAVVGNVEAALAALIGGES